MQEFLTSQNGTRIVDSTCLIFSPWLPLLNFFFSSFSSAQEFFGNYPTPSTLKNKLIHFLLQVTNTYNHLSAVKIMEATHISQVRTNNYDSSTVIWFAIF